MSYDPPMQVVILAGGQGTRLAEETVRIPKPMVTIGGVPILVHIMHIYSYYGFQNFLIAGGYKVEVIESFFESKSKNIRNLGWSVKVQDTGLESGTGGRLLCLKDLLKDDFLLTYGDGLANVNISELVKFATKAPGLATVTAVKPPPRFGGLDIRNGEVVQFSEKAPEQVGWINGGFFYIRQELLSQIKHRNQTLETDILPNLVVNGGLYAYQHYNWWHPMDTIRDKNFLQNLYRSKQAPWLHDPEHEDLLGW